LPAFRSIPLVRALPGIGVASAEGGVTVAEPAGAARRARAGAGLPGRLGGARGWWAARPALAAAVIYAVLSVAFVGQGLLPGRTLSSSDGLYSTAPWSAYKPPGVRPLGANYELADAVAVFQPFFEHTKRVAPDVPLWNPHVMGGRPFLANAQSAVFSPFTMPIHLMSLWDALAVMAVLKLFVAAFGMYVLGRALGMRFGGALVAGIVFAWGTFFVTWLPWPLTNVFPLIPWLLLLTEIVVRRPGPLPVAGLAALVALQFFGGHPETSFHVMVVVTGWFALRALLAWSRGGRRREDLVRPTLAYGLAVAGGTAAAAVVLLPLVELLWHSGDYARRLKEDPSHSDARYLGALLLFDYWGRPTQTPLAIILSNRGYYAGGLTLILAAVALVVRPTATRVALAALAVLSVAIAVGTQPLFDLVTSLPGFRTAHNGRLVIFLLVALALLAGWGLDELSRRDRPPRARRRLALGAGAAIFAAPVVWMLVAGTLEPRRLGPALEVAWGFADAPPLAPGGSAARSDAVATIRLGALLEWLPLAGVGLALVALRLTGARFRGRGALPAAAFVALAAAVLVADLFRANMGFNPAIPDDHAQQPTTGAIRYLQGRRPNRFAGFDRVEGPVLQPDLAMRYGLYDARGYDYPVERRFDRIWRATSAPPTDLIPPTTRVVATARALRTASLLSVADMIQDPTDPPVRLPGLRLAYSGRDARVYRNDRALPRAFLVDRQRTVDGADAALAAVTDPRFDGRRVAVTERAVPDVQQDDGGAGAPAGTARLVSYSDERVVARADAARAGLLVLTDVHFPGWKATVDGRPATIERVDYLLRGVKIPAGVHTVEFRYEPASWRAGWIVSAVAALAIAATAFAGLRARRRRPSQARAGAPA
jgi:hypothetical protein